MKYRKILVRLIENYYNDEKFVAENVEDMLRLTRTLSPKMRRLMAAYVKYVVLPDVLHDRAYELDCELGGEFTPAPKYEAQYHRTRSMFGAATGISVKCFIELLLRELPISSVHAIVNYADFNDRLMDYAHTQANTVGDDFAY